MVIKGTARGGAAQLAKHLLRVDTNERAELVELQGVAAHDLKGALLEIEAVASGARSQRHFYHASINTRADERMTAEQRDHAIDRLAEELGLTGQPRAVMLHEKEGRQHFHVVWSRIELETLKAIPDSHNFRRHEIVARELEREFGHEHVPGVHYEREGERPDRTPSHAEMMQAARSGMKPEQAKALITGLWQATDSGQAFTAALEDQGWILARGDRRDFVAVDPAGDAHSLAKRVDGAKAKDVRARMADIDRESLPSAAEARAQQQERAAEQAREPEPAPEPPPQPMPDPVAEQLAWEDKLAEAAQAKAKWEAGQEQRYEAKAVLFISPAAIEREVSYTLRQEELAERKEQREQAAEHRETKALIHEADKIERGVQRGAEKLEQAAEQVAGQAISAVAEAGNKLMNAVDSALDFLMGSPPPRKLTALEVLTDPAARAEHLAQQQAGRAREKALDRISETYTRGEEIRADDVRLLSRADLENIKARGDDALREMVRQREEERERERQRSRGRER